MTWQEVAQRIAQANPGLKGPALLYALKNALPFMQQDSRMWYQLLQAEMQREQMATRRGIAEEGFALRDKLATMSDATKKELFEKGIISKEDIAASQITSRETIAGEKTASQEKIAKEKIDAAMERLTVSYGFKEAIKQMDIDARRDLQEYLEAGREARSVRAQGGLAEREEMREHAALDRLQASAGFKKELAGLNNTEKEKLQGLSEMWRNYRTGLQVAERAREADIRQKSTSEALAERTREFDASYKLKLDTLQERVEQDLRTSKIRQEAIDQRAAAAREKLEAGAIDSQSVELTAQAIYSYRQPPFVGYAGQRPYGRAVMARVQQIGQERGRPYDVTNWSGKKRMIDNFASGPEGRSARSIYVADQHMQVLHNLKTTMDVAMSNSPNATPALLAVKNWIRTNVKGAPEPNSFDAIRNIIAIEVIKAVSVAGGSAMERMEQAGKINPNMNLNTIDYLLGKYREIMAGQIAGLKKQWGAFADPRDFDEKFGQNYENFSPVGGPGAQPTKPQTPTDRGFKWEKSQREDDDNVIQMTGEGPGGMQVAGMGDVFRRMGGKIKEGLGFQSQDPQSGAMVPAPFARPGQGGMMQPGEVVPSVPRMQAEGKTPRGRTIGDQQLSDWLGIAKKGMDPAEEKSMLTRQRDFLEQHETGFAGIRGGQNIALNPKDVSKALDLVEARLDAIKFEQEFATPFLKARKLPSAYDKPKTPAPPVEPPKKKLAGTKLARKPRPKPEDKGKIPETAGHKYGMPEFDNPDQAWRALRLWLDETSGK
jgi:hypothetical protein